MFGGNHFELHGAEHEELVDVIGEQLRLVPVLQYFFNLKSNRL